MSHLHLSYIYNWLLTQYYYLRGKHQEVVDRCTKLISDTCEPGDTAVHYVQRGREYCKLGQYQSAIDDFDKFLSIDLGQSVLKKIFGNILHAQSYSWRGYAYFMQGQYQKAIDDYDKLINLTPKDATAYRRRGNAFGFLGEHQKAVDDCTVAINIDPKLAIAYAIRAKAYHSLGKQDLAASDEQVAEKLGYRLGKGNN